MNETRAGELASAIQHWLDYQVLCRREMLLSEAYLAQPIGEYLRAHHSGEIRAEWTIKGLQTGSRGRPRQLDYALLSRDTGRLVTALEAKWVTKRVERQRIIDDLLRLEFVRSDQEQAVTRYFVVAGLTDDLDEFFKNAKVQGTGTRRRLLGPLLDFAPSAKTVSVAKSQEPWRSLFRDFSVSHGINVPKSFKTRFVRESKGTGACVCVWRILSVQNRTDVSHSEL